MSSAKFCLQVDKVQGNCDIILTGKHRAFKFKATITTCATIIEIVTLS